MASLCHAAFPYCCAELSAMLGSGELLGAPFGQQELRLVLFSKASSPDPKEAKGQPPEQILCTALRPRKDSVKG